MDSDSCASPFAPEVSRAPGGGVSRRRCPPVPASRRRAGAILCRSSAERPPDRERSGVGGRSDGNGDEVVAIGGYRGKHRRSGKPFSVRTAHLWTVRDGKVRRFEQFTNTKLLEDGAA